MQKGRALGSGGGGEIGNDNDLMPYVGAQQTINNDKFDALKTSILKKRSNDQREPMIIMAQNKHGDQPYNSYLKTQNQN